jgi:hypothetical protein
MVRVQKGVDSGVRRDDGEKGNHETVNMIPNAQGAPPIRALLPISAKAGRRTGEWAMLAGEQVLLFCLDINFQYI